MSKKSKHVIFLLVLLFWIGFIFCDLLDNNKMNDALDNEVSVHFSATENFENIDKNESKVESNKLSLETTEQQKKDTGSVENVLSSVDINKISLDSLSSKIVDRYDVLDSLYRNTKDENILKILIGDLLSDYQFDKVRSYLQNVDIFSSSVIDKSDYFYVYINTLSITDPNSMNKFLNLISELKQKNVVSNDEYLYYESLKKIWDREYDAALNTLKQISNQNYSEFIGQFETTITTFKNQKGMPGYYEDALISLMMLKNGYFSIANKLAVDVVLEDNDYILPYQILAYSNFLTKNWDKAISYFYDLSSLDVESKNKYNFYLGISYYWKGDYSNSLTTLYQLIGDPVYKMDVYRYMLLSYEKLGQDEKMVQVWQKMLGDYGLIESDFKYFYDIVFFQPFAQGKESEIYENYSQISYDMVVACYDKFGLKNDTCIYGEVGYNIANGLWLYEEENLVYLAENYPQASIYQALGDYYKRNSQKDLAKKYYLKSVSMTHDSIQETLLRSSLQDVIN